MYSECLCSMYKKINKNDNQKDHRENIQNNNKWMNEVGMILNQKCLKNVNNSECELEGFFSFFCSTGNIKRNQVTN